MKPSLLNQRLRRFLAVLAVALISIAWRTGSLALWSHDRWVERAAKSSRITQIERASRGKIFDRYGICLAKNKSVYQAGILYSAIAQLPKKRLVNGKKELVRLPYVEKLSQFLSREIGQDPQLIEDSIYARAALTPLAPYFFEEELTQRQFARLNARSAKWPGLIVQERAKRVYPLKKVGASLIGYTSAMSEREWLDLGRQIGTLKNYIQMYALGLEVELPKNYESLDHVKVRLKSLQALIASSKDETGKAGIEKQYNEQLQGYSGKRITEINAARAPCKHSSRSYHALPGSDLSLSFSSKLQEHCENLLIEHERLRRGSHLYYDKQKGERLPLAEPWVKGGAIVALDPNDGSVLALASIPRFDPNDFINKSNHKYQQWLETPQFLASVWNQQAPLHREIFDQKGIQEENLFLTWDFYLHLILPPHHPVRLALHSISDISPLAAALQSLDPNLEKLPPGLRALNAQISNPYDEKLLFDLLSLGIDADRFTPNLIKALPARSLSKHFKDKGHFKRLESFVQKECETLFREHAFAAFRASSGAAYLKQMRREENERKTYARPYTYYFLKKEKELFEAFWSEHREEFCTHFIQGRMHELPPSPYTKHLALWEKELQAGAHKALDLQVSWHALNGFLGNLPKPIALDYTKTLTSFEAIREKPLFGCYSNLRAQNLGGLALAFYPQYGFGYMQSRAYQLPSVPGSIFKLVPAYSALMHNLSQGKQNLGPLTIIDRWELRGASRNLVSVAKTLDGKAYSRWYKGGRLPASANRSIGKIDLTRALAMTSNPYFAILCSDILPSSDFLIQSAKELGFGAPTGIDLPYESSGFLPCDIAVNRSGLYSLAIGQHTLSATPLQVAQMLAQIASDKGVQLPTLGKQVSPKPAPVFWPHKKLLAQGGIDFPLFSGPYRGLSNKLLHKKSLKQPIPHAVRSELITGMRAVVQTLEGTAHPSHSRLLPKESSPRKSYLKLFESIAGKTSTAEVVETHSLDQAQKNAIYNHMWFGGISFIEEKPDLIVVVFLPHGTGGKEAAPLMASVVDKHRELEKSYCEKINATGHFSERAK